MSANLICLVTIHGIGFEQAPENGTPGYADGLHQRLSDALGAAVLGDDPERTRTRPGENGPVYVQSLWPSQPSASATPTRESGLARLGRWTSRKDWHVETGGRRLVDGDQPLAHVALVYSPSEAQGPHLGSGFVAMEMSLASALHYASPFALAHMLFDDARAYMAQPADKQSDTLSSLRVRDAALPKPPSFVAHLHPPAAVNPSDPTGILATMRNLENDVAVYISRNDQRERVRSFVLEALLRLASREDVAGIVVNTHSNGTVIAFDVLSRLPAFLAEKVRWFLTAGSPLRKYSELFNWGRDAGNLRCVEGWTNFWDRNDPVADPLKPPSTWHRGDAMPAASTQEGLFISVDPETGVDHPLPIDDREVDNIRHSRGGGLRAHNYWANDAQVVVPMAAILRALVA